MKAIMISDKAKWCALMMNGDKNIEVRTSKALANAIQKLIDENGYAEIYVYCSKDKKHKLEYCDINNGCWSANDGGDYYNGKVVFRFRCYKIEEIAYQGVFERNPFHFLEEESGYGTETLNAILFKKATCLTDKELEDYLNTNKPNKHAYAIHISDLEIFDKPKELGEFKKLGYAHEVFALVSHLMDIEGFNGGIDERYVKECYQCLEMDFKLTKAPQNFCYVEVE